jgi:ATP/maltotriose-dependent transcriptional regulator MalT
MRVLLVGSPAERAHLRSQMDRSMEVAGEFATLLAARSADVEYDAILLSGSFDARPDPLDSTLVLSQSKDERLAQGWPDGDDDDAIDEPLTPREIQVLELLAEGLPNKAIAARLGISDQTVKFHVSSISGKLGAANRTDAVRRAVRRGLITL